MDATPARKTKALLLDDETFLLDMYRIVFERAGWEVTTFGSADPALVALRAGYDPDVILFDITMPGDKSGYEFLESLNSEKLGARSMKVALTNEGQEGELQRLAQLGADAHMVKASYIPSQLPGIIGDMLAAWKLNKAS